MNREYEKRMVNRYERIDVFSPREYRRRIDGIRGVMKRAGVQAAVFLEASEETYAQWMLGVRFLEYIIVPEDGEVTGVLWNELDETGCDPSGQADFSRYLIQKPITPVCEGIRFVNRASDAELVRGIAALRPERIGWIAPKRMTVPFAAAMAEYLPRVETVDLSVEVSLFRAVKSEEEFAAIRQSRDVQRKAFEALPALIRPGRTGREITDELRYMLASMGASGVLSCELVNNGPTDHMLSEHSTLGERRIEHGDRLFALFESNGPGQQHVAFGRHLVLGQPSRDMLDMVSAEIQAHQYAASLMKADGVTTLAQIAVKTRKFANRLGWSLQERVGWNWMHSLGAFLYEQYSLEDYTEDIPLREDTILHCHPLLYQYCGSGRGMTRREVFILNTYRVTRDGPEDLIGIPFGPVVLD